MNRGPLHQFLTGVTAGDAITDQALLIRDWLREAGYQSDIFAWHLHASMEAEVRPMSAYRRGRGETRGIYHHSIGSDVPAFLAERGPRLILIYHNVTPPEYFESSDPLRAYLARQGIEQLEGLRPHTDLALADSRYNETDLRQTGFLRTAVMPLCLQAERYEGAVNDDLMKELAGSGPKILFIGRLAPNKRQEDLVKLLYFLRRIQPQAQLYLIGDRWEVGYDRWVERLAADLKVADGVKLAGKVSHTDMITYLRAADLYVSMSEHEGFGVPLVESMLLDLPVVAYGVTAVPETMGEAGIVFYRKDFAHLAELVDLILADGALRQRIIAGQRSRVQHFMEPHVRRQFLAHLERAAS
jgi:glycosyltransferase involved in cell wall biosynthesis